MRAFVDYKMNETRKLKLVLEGVENNVVKGDNAGYQHFLLFLGYFQKTTFSGLLKTWQGLLGKGFCKY